MKASLIMVVLCCLVGACNSQPGALEEAKKMEAAIKSAVRPGTKPTASGSWTMTARVNGKPWAATSIMPPNGVGRIIGYLGPDYLAIPFSKPVPNRVGKPRDLGPGYSADILLKDTPGNWMASSGSMVYTKLENGWAEGTFNFVCGIGAEKVVVTNGFFRINVEK